MVLWALFGNWVKITPQDGGREPSDTQEGEKEKAD
jgi:hypothetical protein